jgi:anti-sigma factor RsiW
MITRNNYEEFFLLYVDNELSTAERLDVERFVADHPDLKEELDLLLQCKITPDEMPSFSGKDGLFKFDAPQSKGIDTTLVHHGNYEESLLSYIDNELDRTSRQAVIDFIRLHPEKSIELQRLQRTINTPDPDIVFPNKELLYRKEETPARKIAWLPFARIAAAALILGAVGLLVFKSLQPGGQIATTKSGKVQGISNSNNGSIVTPSDTTTDLAQSVTQKTTPDTRPGTDSPSMIPGTKPGQTRALAGTSPSVKKKQAARVTPAFVEPYYTEKKGDTQPGAKGGETTSPVLAQLDPVGPAKTVDNDPGHQMAVVVPKAIDNNSKILATTTVVGYQTQLATTGNMNASFASRKLEGLDDDSQDETTAPRKNKLRGIFRKVTRVLEKTSAREEDDNKKVTIGGFQFALK